MSLVERIGLNMLVFGDGLADNFKKNSNFFYEKFNKSDSQVTATSVADIKSGMFYHLHYLDNSNWMKWSPVFVTNHKKIMNKTIIFAVNFNFIPLQIRASIFDKFMTEENFDKNIPLKVNYQGMYNELSRLNLQYALVEYDASLIKLVHRIHMESVPRFLISQHPKNKYDPKALVNIWKSKIEKSDKRNQEMMNADISDFFNIRAELKDKYKELKGHIDRIQSNQKKFGNK